MTPDRALPHSAEAEMAVLGSILIRPSAFDEVADLRAFDFFLPAHREVFDAMRALVKRGGAIDVLSVGDELRRGDRLKYLPEGEAYLLACANAVPTAENVVHYAKIVAGKAALRRLITACSDIASSAYGDVGDVREFLSESRRRVSTIETVDSDDRPQLIGADMDHVLESIEKRAADPSAYLITTGFHSFDEKMGGLAGGNLVVVAARPGRGKSAFVLQVLIDNATRGVPGLLFSMEMTGVEITERALAQVGEVNTRSIHRGNMSGPEWMRVSSAAGKLHPLPLWLYGKPQKAERICAMIRRWFAKLPPPPAGKRKQAVAAVDYIGLIPSSGDEQDRRHEIAAMTRMFKGLATELDIPIVLLAQLNRESEKEHRKPKISDLRDAGDIEQDANMVIFPWWDGTAPQSGLHPACLIVGKNRSSSPPGEVDVEWQGEYVRFVDLSSSRVPQGRLPYAPDA